jgi:hypothetical protein
MYVAVAVAVAVGMAVAVAVGVGVGVGVPIKNMYPWLDLSPAIRENEAYWPTWNLIYPNLT